MCEFLHHCNEKENRFLWSPNPCNPQAELLPSDLLPATVACVVNANEGQKKNQERKKRSFMSFLFALSPCDVAAIRQQSHIFHFLKLICSLQEAEKQ